MTCHVQAFPCSVTEKFQYSFQYNIAVLPFLCSWPWCALTMVVQLVRFTLWLITIDQVFLAFHKHMGGEPSWHLSGHETSIMTNVDQWHQNNVAGGATVMAHWCLLSVSCQRLSLDSYIVSFFECVASYCRCKEVCHRCVFKMVELDRSLSMSAKLEKQGFVLRWSLAALVCSVSTVNVCIRLSKSVDKVR